jgi:N-methylhydantoinase A
VDAEAMLRRVGKAVESRRLAYFGPTVGELEIPVFSTRAALGATPREGPLVIEEYEATVVVPPGSRASLDNWANIVIDIDAPTGQGS